MATSTVAKLVPPSSPKGLRVPRWCTQPGVEVSGTVEWETRDAIIRDENGQIVFQQTGVEVPKGWSQLATNIVASKYFRGALGTPSRETTVMQMATRVVGTLTRWGQQGGYFSTDEDSHAFAQELLHLILHQKMSFNSPVWFNVGIEDHPQCSACFILSVDDTMDSILDWYRKEGVIFKGGSGSGVNLSRIRSAKESMSGGGYASGPLSFMRAADASAGAIKSGGKTRRAAKMVVLNAEHPDIVDFIQCKAREERKAHTLTAAGYDPSLDGEAYSSIFYQNANNSVRVDDRFMRAVVEDTTWRTRYVTTGDTDKEYQATALFRMLAEAAHECGDPGLQFHTTINDWHTCPNTGPITASNPCSEYMHLDDSACNLASINLMKFVLDDDTFDIPAFKHAIDITILAQDIIVDNSSYPTDTITANARAYRQLGLGYTNLGAMLMSLGYTYDSDSGREFAAALTSLLTGEAYLQSARISEVLGPFQGFPNNRGPMFEVIRKHQAASRVLSPTKAPHAIVSEANTVWGGARQLAERVGYRNAQTTVLAPTGTISFMMDCDTTGIEPDIALVKYKRLVGGGTLKMVNNSVARALTARGYKDHEIAPILEHVHKTGTVEGAPGIQDVALFDCSLKPQNGSRSISPMGHVKMMGAVQPFLSGAISKTVNMPSDASVEDIEEVYTEAWKHGVKAIAVYRDGCKKVQPVGTTAPGNGSGGPVGREPSATGSVPVRKRLPTDRNATCHKFDIAGHEGYLHIGFYDDGSPGEMFIRMAKEGSTISGLMDCVATLTSVALQYGVPLETLVTKFSHVRYEPSGFTQNPDIRMAKSITDYIFRYMGKFLDAEVENTQEATQTVGEQFDAPTCADCGTIMIRSGTCYRCDNCGVTSGCS